jgi:hypothetical protein
MIDKCQLYRSSPCWRQKKLFQIDLRTDVVISVNIPEWVYVIQQMAVSVVTHESFNDIVGDLMGHVCGTLEPFPKIDVNANTHHQVLGHGILVPKKRCDFTVVRRVAQSLLRSGRLTSNPQDTNTFGTCFVGQVFLYAGTPGHNDDPNR